MKTLCISNLNFQLPDGFDGTDEEAVMLLAEYLRDNEMANRGEVEKESPEKARGTVWTQYIDVLTRGKRVSCSIIVHESID